MLGLTLEGTQRLGDYRIVKVLGAGGMGQVYLGVSDAGDKVAVKVIKPDLVVGDQVLQRFAAEVESLRGAYGSRLARFEAADLTGDPPWLAIEFVPGLTLEQYVAERGPLRSELACVAGAMLVEGLQSIHRANLLHRDLKPRNVILGPDGPKIIDLGLAVFRDRDEGLTVSGMLVGTPAYMAPEQARSEANLTTAVDVYALGATLVYALTGATVYPGLRGFDLIEQIRDPNRHPRIDQVPAELRSLVGAMLAHDPAGRPPLDVVKQHLIRVVAAGGRDFFGVRLELVDQTFVDPGPDESEPGDTGLDIEDPPDWSAEASDEPEGPPRGSTDPGPSDDAATRPHPAPRPIDVSWLVDQLRQEYARDARF